jgi:hypothetical protein
MERQVTYGFHCLFDSGPSVENLLCTIAETFMHIKRALGVKFAVDGKRIWWMFRNLDLALNRDGKIVYLRYHDRLHWLEHALIVIHR